VTRGSGLRRRLEVETLHISDCTNIKLSYHTEKESLHLATASHDKLPSQKERQILPTRTHFLLSSFANTATRLGILPAALVVCVIHVSIPVRRTRRSDCAPVVCVVHVFPFLRTARRSNRVLVASSHVQVGIERQPMLGWSTLPLRSGRRRHSRSRRTWHSNRPCRDSIVVMLLRHFSPVRRSVNAVASRRRDQLLCWRHILSLVPRRQWRAEVRKRGGSAALLWSSTIDNAWQVVLWLHDHGRLHGNGRLYSSACPRRPQKRHNQPGRWVLAWRWRSVRGRVQCVWIRDPLPNSRIKVPVA
jgi:hypothetical protein